jgi:hypothetical protein
MEIFESGEAITKEIGDVLSWKLVFMHDFDFQSSKEFTDQPLILPTDCTLVAILGKFKTAPVGCAAIFNVLKNGVAVFSGADRPTLAAGATKLVKTGINEVFAAEDVLTFKDEQKGSSTAGGYGSFVLVFK